MLWGGSHAVTLAAPSAPGPMWQTSSCGRPSAPAMKSVGNNQHASPGPVAMASQTSRDEPGTSTDTWTDRRPWVSTFTAMAMALCTLDPGICMSAAGAAASDRLSPNLG